MQKLKKIGASSVAAAGAAALVLGLSSAPAMAAVTPSFGNVSATIASSTSVPSGSTTTRYKDITLKFDGPAASTSNRYYNTFADYYGPKVASYKLNAGVKSTYLNKPSIEGVSGQLNPAASSTPRLRVSQYTTPGKYKLNVPVTQRNGSTVVTQSGIAYITVNASTSISKQLTYASGSGRVGSTWSIKVAAPDYQSGAKTAIYAKLKGQKSYHKATTATTLKASTSGKSRATLKLPGKYTKKGTKFYVKVTSVSYAPGYNDTGYSI